MLTIIAFGQPISWQDNTTIPKGHQMSMKDTLHSACHAATIFARTTLPDWVLTLTNQLQTIKMTFEELQVHVVHLIDST